VTGEPSMARFRFVMFLLPLLLSHARHAYAIETIGEHGPHFAIRALYVFGGMAALTVVVAIIWHYQSRK
jgi:hypothetical protein